jgi:cation diffusion facilitator CzcD-associated flavoprotein CzcO
LDYFNNVAERFDVTRHVVPNTEWEGAFWQELTSTWLVKLKDLSTGQLYYQECKLLISAVGGLVNPNQFDVPGIDDFQGDIIHTARWKTDVSLHDKDVIVVGNGCKI